MTQVIADMYSSDLADGGRDNPQIGVPNLGLNGKQDSFSEGGGSEGS